MNRAERAAPAPNKARGIHGGEPSRPLVLRAIAVRGPEPDAPFWRGADGRRHSYCSLRCRLDAECAVVLREAHCQAIHAIAAAALAARERGDQRETARLAMAAGRLCGEIAGHWPPSAVGTPVAELPLQRQREPARPRERRTYDQEREADYARGSRVRGDL